MKRDTHMAGAKQVKGRWYGYYVDPDGRERSAGGADNRNDAIKLALIAEVALEGGSWADPTDGRQTFRQYVEKTWWPNHRVNLEVSSQIGYWSKMQHDLLPAFGDKRMNQLRHTTFQSWVAESRRAGKSPANIHSAFRVLRVIMRAATRDGVISANPVTEVQLPKLAKKKWTILEPSQADAFEAALTKLGKTDKKSQIMILLEMELGARFSELRGLRPRHLNDLRSRVTICETVMDAPKSWLDEIIPQRPDLIRIADRWYCKPYTKDGNEGEGHGTRTVAIDPAVMRMLRAYIQDREIGPDELLFVSDAGKRHKGGLPIHNSDFNRDVWKPLLEAAGIAALRPHDLRHTAASWALDGGASLAEVMEMMGHRQIATTQLYAHPLEDAPDNVLAARKRARQKRQTG